MVKSSMFVTLFVGITICFAACHGPQSSERETPVEAASAPVADKAFVAGGKVDIDLDGGGYEIRPAGDNHIRVAVSGAASAVKVDVAVDGNQANVKIKNTPHNNFRAIVEVPSAADVVVRLTGGELKMGAITGNKDVESYGGNVELIVAEPNEYSRVDAAVKAGELNASPFGASKSGLMQEFSWSGPGKYTLRVHLGAGNLTLASK